MRKIRSRLIVMLAILPLALTPGSAGDPPKPNNTMWGTEVLVDLTRSPVSKTMDGVLEAMTHALEYPPIRHVFDLHAAEKWKDEGAIAFYDANPDRSKNEVHRNIYYGMGLEARFKRDPRDWHAYVILAHEVGHHFLKHSLAQVPTSNQELEADRFAGCVVARLAKKGYLQGTIAKAEAVYTQFAPESGVGTHPARATRLKMLAEGWKVGSGPNYGTCLKMKPL